STSKDRLTCKTYVEAVNDERYAEAEGDESVRGVPRRKICRKRIPDAQGYEEIHYDCGEQTITEQYEENRGRENSAEDKIEHKIVARQSADNSRNQPDHADCQPLSAQQHRKQ